MFWFVALSIFLYHNIDGTHSKYHAEHLTHNGKSQQCVKVLYAFIYAFLCHQKTNERKLEISIGSCIIPKKNHMLYNHRPVADSEVYGVNDLMCKNIFVPIHNNLKQIINMASTYEHCLFQLFLFIARLLLCVCVVFFSHYRLLSWTSRFNKRE